jgi:tetratricopeptide (TPR) repeat protein
MKYLLSFLLFICQTTYSQDTARLHQIYKLAMALEDKGDLEGAMKLQKQIFTLDARNYVSANVIAGLYGKMGSFAEEINWGNKVVQMNPKFSLGFINLGNGYAGSGNMPAAEKCFKQSLALDPLNKHAYYSLGVVEESRNNFKAAIGYYEKSVSVDSSFEDAYFNLAAAYANLKDFTKANQYIVKVLALNPGSRDAQQMRAEIAKELRKNE